MPLFRRRVDRLGEHDDCGYPQRHLAGSRFEERSRRLNEIAEVEQLEDIRIEILADGILADIELETGMSVLDMGEYGSAHMAEADDATNKREGLGYLFIIGALTGGFGFLELPERFRVIVRAPGAIGPGV